VLVLQQLRGEPQPFVLHHHLAGIAMGEGIQASKEGDPTIHHDDLLVHME